MALSTSDAAHSLIEEFMVLANCLVASRTAVAFPDQVRFKEVSVVCLPHDCSRLLGGNVSVVVGAGLPRAGAARAWIFFFPQHKPAPTSPIAPCCQGVLFCVSFILSQYSSRLYGPAASWGSLTLCVPTLECQGPPLREAPC
eukprot:scaffold31220_cov84-Isochrysis_galbana.AAC.1